MLGTYRTRTLVATLVAGACLVGVSALKAAEQTWTGQISDHICAWSHKDMAQQVGYTDQECAVQCIKSGGKFVFVTGGATFQITNQDFAHLLDYTGKTVKLTGEKTGDLVVVTKIEAVPDAK